VYYLATEEYQLNFLSNPDKFLNGPFQIKKMRVCILGGPYSGKTTHSKLIALRHHLTYISIDEILQEIANDSHPDELGAAVTF
jgi:hypothetical protein